MSDAELSVDLPPDASISQVSALEYWNRVPANVNGMLGGLSKVSRADLQGSANFIAKLKGMSGLAIQRSSETRITRNSKNRKGEEVELFDRAVDCGAGIGRVTKGLLVRFARVIDIVEPVEKFSAVIAAELNENAKKLGKIYNTGLESWAPEVEYDLFWNQWCLGQLTDKQLTEYLKLCQQHLKKGGWIVVKENLSGDPEGRDIFDEVDSSVTRSDIKWRSIFSEAGLKIVATELQRGFVKGLFAVRLYALQPQ